MERGSTSWARSLKNSKLVRVVDKAYDAMRSLHLELHYIACGHGVGRRDGD